MVSIGSGLVSAEESPSRLGLPGFRPSYLLIFALFALITGPIFFDPVQRDAPRAVDGRLVYKSGADFDRPVGLAGDWRLEWLDAPSAINRQPIAMTVPGGWAGRKTASGQKLPTSAVVRYSLVLSGLPKGNYRLYVAPFYAANRVLIDGRPVAQWGQIGASSATSRYHVRAHDIAFAARGGDTTIAVEMSTFQDVDTGFRDAPILGSPQAIQTWVALEWAKEFLFDAALILAGLFGLVVYFTRRLDRAALFLGLGTLTFLLPMLIYGFENIWMLALPGTPHLAMVLVLWLGSWLSLILWLHYVRALFPQETPHTAFRAMLALLWLATAAQLGSTLLWGTLGGSIFNRSIFFWPFLASFLLIVWITVHAIRARRTGSTLFLIGQAAYIGSLLLMLSVSFGFVGSDVMVGFDFAGIGILIYLLSHIMILAERWSAAIQAAEALNGDLGQLLEVNSAVTSDDGLEILLTRIVAVTSRILNAERSSLFLHDPKRGELWSLVAEQLEVREIRIPDDRGVVGSVFQAGEALLIADAYRDDRFDPAIDRNTGYRTRNLLTVPVVARDGRKIGVLQALNSLSPTGFSDADLARASAFAAQAAIAIDNATLFSEVVASRNYNESILQSMSSGVVTLQDEARAARLNAAAARILRVQKEAAERADARAFLAETNPALLPEIDLVQQSGESKSLLDRELNTGSGEAISANISIVPLRDAEQATGVLLMLDDISDGKRLQGAMRRFMTQEVMEEVLGRGDDTMFGNACTASVLFADIRNFTTLAETLTPREVVDMLNEIFTDLYDAVSDAGGVLDKYIGDAVMAVFGAPIASDRDPANAVLAALRMQEMMAAINARRMARGQSELRLGIGIASGEIVAGTIGSPKRMDYTVIGDSVNLASRLQDATKTYGVSIIVCEATARAVADVAQLRQLDQIRVKGRERLERIFEVSERSPANL